MYLFDSNVHADVCPDFLCDIMCGARTLWGQNWEPRALELELEAVVSHHVDAGTVGTLDHLPRPKKIF